MIEYLAIFCALWFIVYIYRIHSTLKEIYELRIDRNLDGMEDGLKAIAEELMFIREELQEKVKWK